MKEWEKLLRDSNKELKEVGVKIVVEREDNTYSVYIEYADKPNYNYACGYFEEELYELLLEVALYAQNSVINDGQEIVSYKRIHGDTHGAPALVLAYTHDVSLYFSDAEKGNMELVEDIDLFEGREGTFYVKAEDYQKAMDALERDCAED